tara:strand:- start:61 stop:396 length:336 start_codon:yes stop_codon:yes gene_type:complete
LEACIEEAVSKQFNVKKLNSLIDIANVVLKIRRQLYTEKFIEVEKTSDLLVSGGDDLNMNKVALAEIEFSILEVRRYIYIFRDKSEPCGVERNTNKKIPLPGTTRLTTKVC